ncbi:MAG: hypothetical protein AAFV80_06550 [Bacteroidota bacterium]
MQFQIRKWWGLVVGFILPLAGWAQPSVSFMELVEQTNTYLDIYSGLSPFYSDEYLALKDSRLPKVHQDRIKAEAIEFDEPYPDSILTYDLQAEYQSLIMQTLVRLTEHPDFEKHDLFELLSEDSDLWIVRSDDGKLYNFSLDEKTGGTYRSRLSLMYYSDWDIERTYSNPRDWPDDHWDPYSIFAVDGYDRIDTLMTPTGVKYLLSGYVRGCTACFETSVLLVSFDTSAVRAEFSYSVTLRSYEEGVYYDPESRTITVEYETDDLTSDCGCSNELDLEPESTPYWYTGTEDALEPIECRCVFQFNGEQFELIESSPEDE